MSTTQHDERIHAKLDGFRRADRRRSRLRIGLWIGGLVVAAGIVTAGLLSAVPSSSSEAEVAPGFTLTDTNGQRVSLASYRGRNVLLYFSEGAGCEACLTQLGAIEKDRAFAKEGITVLPVVMNTRDQILADARRTGVESPFLLDDGTVSKEYGTLGKGMHSDLPGHSFVLVDAQGTRRWYQDYPSMWIAPKDLLAQVEKHLRS